MNIPRLQLSTTNGDESRRGLSQAGTVHASFVSWRQSVSAEIKSVYFKWAEKTVSVKTVQRRFLWWTWEEKVEKSAFTYESRKAIEKDASDFLNAHQINKQHILSYTDDCKEQTFYYDDGQGGSSGPWTERYGGIHISYMKEGL